MKLNGVSKAAFTIGAIFSLTPHHEIRINIKINPTKYCRIYRTG
jgi:hypothetical protein